jgi:hypothetical protein
MQFGDCFYNKGTLRVSSVVAYWTRTHVVMGSNPGEVNFFHAVAMLLLFNMKERIDVPKLCIFRKCFTVGHCMILYFLALLSISSRKIVRPPWWYYRL